MSYSVPIAVDHERLFRLIHEEAWAEAAQFLHRHYRLMPEDALLQHGSETFISSIETALEDSRHFSDQELLEQLFLLHTGQFLVLPPALLERVVEGLVRVHTDEPEAALAYARHAPMNPHCATVLEAFGEPSRQRLESAMGASVQVTEVSSLRADATRPLLRSAQELAFFRAVRTVFPTHLVYPNVALSAVLDFERLRSSLTPNERRYFFHALVDCVVFDPIDGCWPQYFFELDSPLHDDVERQKRDRQKDRILSAAGQRLYRIRGGADRSEGEFLRVIRHAMNHERAHLPGRDRHGT